MKSDCVQQYRSLNICDERTIETIQVKGHNAHCNYTAAYKDFVLTDQPRFLSLGGYVLHAEQLKKRVRNFRSRGYTHRGYVRTQSEIVEKI